jgi:hypothetical protein
MHMPSTSAALSSLACKTIPAAIALMLLGVSATAQTIPATPATNDKPADTKAAKPAVKASADAAQPSGEIATVNVVSERQTNRVDRQVFDIKNDASTAGASIGDVLNNVPSVNVDPNGTVRLRGSERVTVLVDGKPTAQLQGENRAAAINALPAENYESVQVINNPGAEFGNEAGGGPILNLISRRYTKPGGNGSMATHDCAGRPRQRLCQRQLQRRLRVGERQPERAPRRQRHRHRRGARAHRPGHRRVSRLRQDASRHGVNTFVQAGVGGRYNYNERDTVTGSVSLNKRGADADSNEHFTDYRTGQTPVVDYLTRRKTDGDALNHEIVTGFERRFSTDGETLKVDLRHSSNTNTGDTATLYQDLSPPCACGPVLRDYAQDVETRVRMTDLSTDYSGKAGPGFLSTGGRWQRIQQSADNRYVFLGGGAAWIRGAATCSNWTRTCWPPTAPTRCR